MTESVRYRLSLIKLLRENSKNYFGFTAAVCALDLVAFSAAFLEPLLYREFISKIILEQKLSLFIFIAIGYVLFYLEDTAVGYVKYIIVTKFSNSAVISLKSKLFSRQLVKPPDGRESNEVGDLKLLLEDDSSHIADFAVYQSVDLIFHIIYVFAVCVMMVLLDVRLSVLSFIMIPVTFIIDRKISKKENSLNRSNRENERKMLSRMEVSAGHWREIKSGNLEKYEEHQYCRYTEKHADYFGRWINLWVARVLIVPKLKDDFFMNFCLFFFGGLLIINGRLHIANFLTFAAYYNIASAVVRSISKCGADLAAGKVYTDRLLCEAGLSERQSEEKVKDFDLSSVRLNGVVFSYPGEKNEIIAADGLEFHKGDRICICGKSGSGKSTFVKLISGMIKPCSGKVEYSGTDLSKIDTDSLFSRVGVVMQETRLFGGTVRDNLLYAAPGATEDEMRRACEAAGAAGFIKELPDGLDTVIGENGIRLSSGQRQKLVLARALIKDSEMYIFDEATANVDRKSEEEIYRAIGDISADKTVFIVSHNGSAQKICDKILFLPSMRMCDTAETRGEKSE